MASRSMVLPKKSHEQSLWSRCGSQVETMARLAAASLEALLIASDTDRGASPTGGSFIGPAVTGKLRLSKRPVTSSAVCRDHRVSSLMDSPHLLVRSQRLRQAESVNSLGSAEPE